MAARRQVNHLIKHPVRPSHGGTQRGSALVMIGGPEDRAGEKRILREVAARLGDERDDDGVG